MARSPSDDSKFRRLYGQNFVAMRNYCLRRLPASEVGDAVAEVFLVMWRRIDVAPDGEEARLWLYGIARNVVRNTERALRRRARLNGRLHAISSRHEPGPETVVVQRTDHAEVIDALAELRPADQEILRLSVWEELGNSEVAAVLDIETHAATMRLSRARNRLAKRLHMPREAPIVRTDPQPVGEGGEQ